MQYIFFGTPEFAAIILEKLIKAGTSPLAIVCAPDKPIGRKQIITPPSVKQLITNSRWSIEILQPENLKSVSWQTKLKAINADVFIVAAYAQILSKEILAIPRMGTIAVHPSLLSKYRGVSPIQSAILSDEKETGTTIFLADEKVDHGPILAYGKWPVANSNYEKLLKELAELSGNLLIETLPKFIKGEITPQSQNETKATYTKKFSAKDALVDLKNDSPKQIWLKIRALNPEPGVVAVLELKNNKKLRLKLLEADFTDGKLELKKVQPEGKTSMTHKEFLNGYQNLLVS